jgi:hypothetical protein
MQFPSIPILAVIIFSTISVGTTYAVLETFDDVEVSNNLTVGNQLGIGTTSPAPNTALDVNGVMSVGGGRFMVGGFDGSDVFWFRGANAPEPNSVFIALIQNPDGSANSVKIAPQGAKEGIYVDSQGRVGIGTSSPNPNAAIDVNGIMSVGGGRFMVGGFDGSNNFWFRSDAPEPNSVFMALIQNPDGSANSVKIAPQGARDGILVDSQGRVGIGTANPNHQLDVNGDMRISGNILSSGDICIGTCS